MQLGIREIKNYNWPEAEKYLRIAVDRVTMNYTRAKDCEPLYYLGIALRKQGKIQEAYDMLYRASWDYAWNTASYYQLAEIDSQRGDLNKSLEHLNRSLLTGSDNIKALTLKVMVLRKLGLTDLAKEIASDALKVNLLSHAALNELFLLNKLEKNSKEANENFEELTCIMRDDVQSYLELATDYINSGFYEEAEDLLSRLEGKNDYPMLYYYLGYCHLALGNKSEALKYYKLANEKPYIYCFPFRAESISVLEDAMKNNPNDARAPYYLGNLLYEHQPERAISLWERSAELDDSFYIVHRNLGIAYKEIRKDKEKAMASYEKALESNNKDPRLLYEIDEIYTLNNVPLKRRYEFLKENQVIAKQRAETLLRLVTRSVEYGKYDEAIEILLNNKIVESEGAREMRNTYLNAYTFRALEYIKNREYTKAMKDVETALSYPFGIDGRTRLAQLNYIQGLINEHEGKTKESERSFQNALEVNFQNESSDLEYKFYQGLANKKLGNLEKAKNIFQNILANIKSIDEEGSSFFTQFDRAQSINSRKAQNNFIAGLAYMGLGNQQMSKKEFAQSLELEPNNIWIKSYLDLISFD